MFILIQDMPGGKETSNNIAVKNQFMLFIPIEFLTLDRELGFPWSTMVRTTSHVNLGAFLVAGVEMQVGVAGGSWTRVRIADYLPVSSTAKDKGRIADFAAI